VSAAEYVTEISGDRIQRASGPDALVPYWPAYIPPGPGAAVPYRLTPLADALLAESAAEPEAGL
jgi:hypothetical protein